MSDVEAQLYSKQFFEGHQEGSRSSAREIVPLVLNLLQPESVVDVGCGIGTWLSVFREFGIKECLGIDGNYVDKELLLFPQEDFLSADLKKSLSIDKRFDLVVSLEVAEHLPEECAETFVESLVKLGEIVLFSAAVPFQGGTGHLNEQWPHYWLHYFQKHEYLVADCLRGKIWNNNSVMPWYAQNLLIFVKQDCIGKFPLLAKEIEHTNTSQLAIVHPNTYLSNLHYLQRELKSSLGSQSNSTLDKLSYQVRSEPLQKTTLKSGYNINISTSLCKKPRIDVVLQATGIHGWSFSRGWANILQKEGLLHRAFTPIADFEANEPRVDDGLFDYLKNPQADIILLLGFDWHSQPLHKTLRWQEQWHEAPIKKIALLQECYSAEVVQSTPEWKQRMHQAITSTLPCVDALVCNHEPDVDFLQTQESICLPVTFLPFYVDVQHFQDQTPFKKRMRRAFFRGNALKYFTEKTYSKRLKLLEVLSNCKNIDILPFDADLLSDPFRATQTYVNELNSYQLLLNLPSITPTLTARPFEIMACGGLLLQDKVIGQKSNKLFQDWEHLVYYDSENSEELLDIVQHLIKNQDIAEKIADQGYKLCRENHTIERRIYEILEWSNSNFAGTSNITSMLEASHEQRCLSNNFEHHVRERQKVKLEQSCPIVIVDSVFFQIYKTGIARVWHSLLEEWVNNGFAEYVVVIDRGETAPKISGIRYRLSPAYDYSRTDADRKMLQQVCDEEGADLFISTYYTTPISTPSVFMAYDMIPEVVGADLNTPMWREKHHGIQHASAYVAISESTARDLVTSFPDVSPESITVAHCGVQRIFSPADCEVVSRFKAKYGISKPYFVLVGAGSGYKESYKNTILFFKAFSTLYSRQAFEVVCTGGGLLEDELRAYTSGSTVHMLQLNDEELRAAYSGAVALVYPSKYEGFGLPVLEAIACGCPVITCPNASIPEVAGEAALYVNDEDVDGLANALCDVQKPSVRNSLIAAGLAQAKKFSWSTMASTVSSALIDATLLPFNLKGTNLIVFPDWAQPEDSLSQDLASVIRAVVSHPDKSGMTLLIDTSGISEEDANLALSAAAMNLLLEEDLDVTDGPEISLLGKLGGVQWEALLPRIQARISLENENKQAIAAAKAANVPLSRLQLLI